MMNYTVEHNPLPCGKDGKQYHKKNHCEGTQAAWLYRNNYLCNTRIMFEHLSGGSQSEHEEKNKLRRLGGKKRREEKKGGRKG